MRSVWSRRGRGLDDGRRAVGDQAGEQHARLDLRAGDRQLVGDRAQARAVDGERREAAVGARRSRAPMRRSGSAMRSTGRRRIDASPSSVYERPSCPASQPGSRRISVPALPTSIGAVGLAGVAQAGAADDDLAGAASLDQRAERAHGVERRVRVLGVRGSCGSRTGSAAIAPSIAARCEIDLSAGGGRPSPRRRLGGIEADGGHAAPRDILHELASAAARPRGVARRPTARPRRCGSRAAGESAMSWMLMPARPSVEREVGDHAGPVGHHDAQLPQRAAGHADVEQRAALVAARAPARPPAARGRRRRRPAARGRRAAGAIVASSCCEHAPRGWRRRCRAHSGGLAPATRVASRKLGPIDRDRLARPARCAAWATSTLATHVRQVREGGHQAVVVGVADRRRHARRGRRRSGAGARAARPGCRGRGVRYQVASANRSARACSTPAISAPASGWPPMKRVGRRGLHERALGRADVGDDARRGHGGAARAATASGQRVRRARRRAPTSAPPSRARRRRPRASSAPRSQRPRAHLGVGVPAGDVRAEPLAGGEADRPADQPDAERRATTVITRAGRRSRRRAACRPATAACSTLRGVLGELVDAQLLRAVADRLVGLGVHLDDDAVGARRGGGQRQRLDERAAAGGVAGVDDRSAGASAP